MGWGANEAGLLVLQNALQKPIFPNSLRGEETTRQFATDTIMASLAWEVYIN